MKRFYLSALLLTSCATTPAPEPAPPVTEKVEAPKVDERVAWRSEPPAEKPTPEPIFPALKTATLKNGLVVLVSEVRALPVVSFMIVTRGGGALDPMDRAGLATITYKLLNEGAGKRDALQFSDAVADLGASFSTYAERDAGGVSVSGLARVQNEMLELLSDAVLRPRFDKKAFDRIKSQTLGQIVERRSGVQGLATEFSPGLIYGRTHPYGRPVDGAQETVQKIELSDVKNFAKRVLAPNESALIAVGDIDLETATALAEKHFSKWARKKDEITAPPEVQAEPRKGILFVHKAPSAQTMILIGRPLFSRGHPDEETLAVLNEIYGGAFTSRLNMNLREDKGYTYGASSVLTLRSGASAFLSYSLVREDATAPSVVEFMDELDRLKSSPPSNEEVARAKDSMIRSLTGSFETTSEIAGAAAQIFAQKLPLDYFARQVDKVGAVDPGAVLKAAEKYFSKDVMQILLVGNSDAVLESVKNLGLGPVELVIPHVPSQKASR